MSVRRRQFIGMLAAGAAAAATALAAGYGVGDLEKLEALRALKVKGVGFPRNIPRPIPSSFALPPHFLDPGLARRPAPVHRTLTSLPGEGNLVALTIDDGVDSAVVASYAQFCLDSGMRLTFFLNGSRPSWTEHASLVAPLVHSGQVQLANHSWSHPDLGKLSDAAIADELLTNDAFIRNTYGVDARPYFRPPYGNHDERVRAVAASVGYTVPVLWYGSLSDAADISDQQLMESATSWLLPQHIVIGHANFPTVTRHFAEIAAIIRARGLVPVTLDDVFARP